MLEKGYQVHGLIRPSSQRREALNPPLHDEVTLRFGDLSDLGKLLQILSEIPIIEEIYHLAEQSHVGVSFQTPLLTSDANALGSIRLLEAVRILDLGRSTRIYSVLSDSY